MASLARPTEVRFAYAETAFGQIHYAQAGGGRPLLCLHQTPRSWDEYRELLPLLAERCTVIAMDTVGMGQSSHSFGPASIETYAAAAVALLDVLGIPKASVMGHHTGGVIALEMAARHPARVDRLVLSSTPYVDAASRLRRSTRPPIDHVRAEPDGSHLVELWRRRRELYPPDRADLLERFVHDALAARDAEEGHRAVGGYEMENMIGLVAAPTLCIGASADPHSFPDLVHVSSRIGTSRVAVIDGGTVALLEARAGEVARLVTRFLEDSLLDDTHA